MSQLHHETVRLLRDPAPTQRRGTLAEMEREWAEDRLRGFCTFARTLNAGVCVELCQVLAHARSRPMAELLAHYAERDEAPLRRAALSALAQVPGPSRIPALVSLAGSDRAETREAACELLGKSGSTGPASTLLEELEDPVPQVAIAALEALRRLGCGDCVPAVCRLLKRDEDEARAAAVTTLVDLAPEGQFPAAEVGRLAEHDPSESVRVSAAWALGKRPEPSQRRRLLDILEGEESAKVRAAAAEALAAYPDDEVIRALVRACGREPNVSVALRGRNSLSAMPPGRLLDRCREMLRDREAETRSEAALVLGEVDCAGARQVLLDRLEAEREPSVRAALLQALGSSGWRDAWGAVRRHVSDAPRVAHAAICALADLLDEERVEDFVRVLDELEDETLCEAGLRRLAAYARTRGLPRSARPVLSMLLESDRRNLAVLAAETAGWMSDRGMAQPLLQALDRSGDAEFTRVASRSVLRLYDGQVLALLEEIDPACLTSLEKVLGCAEGLGERAGACCRELARMAAEGREGAAETLRSAARLQPGALLEALEGAGEAESKAILRAWKNLPREVRQRADVDWQRMAASSSAPVRMLALDALPADAGRELLPTVVAMAVEDVDKRVRRVARFTAKRMVEMESV